MTKTRPLADRFWEKVDKSGGPKACWLWAAFSYPNGYGAFSISRGRTRTAHRVAYCLSSGIDITNLPSEVVIRHKCDVRACCNPSHLEPGSHADNLVDMHERGRAAVGEKHGNTNLTEAQVREIRALCDQGISQRVIGDRYEITQEGVSQIKLRKRWRHIS